MKIAVVGLWHLGTVTAACLAAAGHQVIGVAEDATAAELLNQAELPVSEPGLKELVQENLRNGHLRFTSDAGEAAGAELVWITYDTPVDDEDRADADFVLGKVAALFSYLTGDALVLISSQIPAGSTRRLEQMYRQACPRGAASFAYSPENLRLGQAVAAFKHPERIVAGVRGEKDKARLAQVFAAFTGRVEWMSVESAEMTKHAVNSFLATSVAFSNELAALCERVGADAREVERGLKSEGRIGPRAYVRAGAAFSGGTLGRDVSYLAELGRREQLPTPLFSAVQQSNDAHRQWPCRALLRALGSMTAKKIAVLGLTYKPSTNTLRRSDSVALCGWLRQQGAAVVAFDPALAELPAELAFVEFARSGLEALGGTDAAVLATEWPEFKQISAEEVTRRMRAAVVVDAGGFLQEALGGDERIRYFTVGSPRMSFEAARP